NELTRRGSPKALGPRNGVREWVEALAIQGGGVNLCRAELIRPVPLRCQVLFGHDVIVVEQKQRDPDRRELQSHLSANGTHPDNGGMTPGQALRRNEIALAQVAIGEILTSTVHAIPPKRTARNRQRPARRSTATCPTKDPALGSSSRLLGRRRQATV